MDSAHTGQPSLEDADQAQAGAQQGELGPRLRKLTGKYARKLCKNFEVTLESGDEDAVHDLRVGTRRLQAIVELLAPKRASKKFKRLKKDLKKLRHAVGDERDLRLFVQTARRRARVSASPMRRRVWREIAADLTVEFAAAADAARKRLQQRRAGDLMRHAKRMVRTTAGRIAPNHLAKVIADARRKLVASLHEAGTSHAAAKYHDVRIKAKSLRYLLEISAKATPGNADEPLIELLKSAQDELGEWHDEIELCRRATAALSTDADRQGDTAATAVLDSMRRRSGAANQHARGVVEKLRGALPEHQNGNLRTAPPSSPHPMAR